MHIKAPARHFGKSCVTRSQNASGSKVRLRAVRLPVHQARRRYRLKRFLDLWQGWGWGGGSFQDVGLKRDQVVVGEVGDVRRRILVALLRLHGEKVASILVPGTRGSIKTGGKEELARCYTRNQDKKSLFFHLFCCLVGSTGEECLPPASHTPREGRGARTNFLWELPGSARLPHTFKSFPHTHVWSTESVDEGLSFSSGGLWSKTMVSVLARQNPLDRMISKRDTEGGVGHRGRRGQPPGQPPPTTGADLIS